MNNGLGGTPTHNKRTRLANQSKLIDQINHFIPPIQDIQSKISHSMYMMVAKWKWKWKCESVRVDMEEDSISILPLVVLHIVSHPIYAPVSNRLTRHTHTEQTRLFGYDPGWT
jgi:hypothetical protein